MKTLVLVNHAQADDTNPSVGDIERTLTPAGARAAVSLTDQLAEKLVELDVKVDVLLSSHAHYSRSTAEVIASKLSLEVQVDRRLYDGGVIDFLEAVRSLEYQHDVAVLVGDNPSLSEFMRYLTDAKRADISLGSATIVELAVNSWRHVVIGKGLLRIQLFPAVEVVKEVKIEPPPPPRGWRERLCLWLDLKTEDDEDHEEKKP